MESYLGGKSITEKCSKSNTSNFSVYAKNGSIVVINDYEIVSLDTVGLRVAGRHVCELTTAKFRQLEYRNKRSETSKRMITRKEPNRSKVCDEHRPIA